MRLKALSLTALALVVILYSVVAQAAALELPATEGGLETKARAMINIAAKAETRVYALIDMIEENETIMKAIVDAGLNQSLNEMVALRDQGSALLEEARKSLEAGNYTESIEKAIEAMRLLRDAYAGIHRILCQAGVVPLKPEEIPEIRAQGLLVAANRSLERIRNIRSLPNAAEVESLLSKAEGLLSEVKAFLEQGNVSAAAHKLAEANKLISEAFVRLRHRAEEMVRTRAEKFILNFGRIHNEFTKRIREEELNETEVLNGLGGLGQTIMNLADMIRGAGKRVRDVIKDLREDLKSIGDFLREIRKVIPERPSIRAKIGEILVNPSAFSGKTVRVEGKYCGTRPPEDLQGPVGGPPKNTWWILADETGWIYVAGEERMSIMRRMPLLEGANVTLIGMVIIEGDGTLYIKAMLTSPKRPIVLPVPPRGPIKPIVPGELLKMSVEVERAGKEYSIKVTIENIGNETIIFPNSAYGIIIERKTVITWVPVYAPIAAQVLTRLEPGEAHTIVIPLERPLKPLSPGTYRVVTTGWLERSGLPVTTSAEFEIP